MKRILVGDDGSNTALFAVEQASELAAKTGADLIALAVFERSSLEARDLEAFARSEDIDVVEAEVVLIKNAGAVLDRCRGIADRWGVTGYRQECLGADDAALAIIAAAQHDDVDLIVVGTGDRSGLPGLLLGSVSHKVASDALCSVLIARARNRVS